MLRLVSVVALLFVTGCGKEEAPAANGTVHAIWSDGTGVRKVVSTDSGRTGKPGKPYAEAVARG